MNISQLKNKLKTIKIKEQYLGYVLNYYLFKNNLPLYSKFYKIIIKDIGCNAKCPMCKDWKNKWDLNKIKINLYKVLKNIITDKVKNKKIFILWWEPLIIFDDIVKIIKIWTKYNIKFDFPTNASLLNYKKIDQLINAWLNRFSFSIDFPDEKHDKYRSLDWSFEKIINFTRYLKEKKVEVQWNTVVWKFNFNQISKFPSLFKKISPNIHSFINLGNEYEGLLFNKKNILNEIEIQSLQNQLDIIKNKEKTITFIFNWFINIDELNSINKCYIPLSMKSYIIDENNIIDSMCHYHWEVKNNYNFIKEAITNWCNKCKSWLKYNLNNYMDNIIKEIDNETY